MLMRFTDPRLGDLGPGFPALGDLRREVDRLFGDFDRMFDAPGGLGDPALGPRASLRDEGERLVLRVELPGWADDELDVSLERDVLTLRGAHEVEVPEGFQARHRERRGARFARTFALPVPVDADRAEATLEQGVLTLTLPKAAGARPTKVTVRAAS